MNTELNISGMTCGHCVASVTEELTAIGGVEDVKVDLQPEGISTAVITSTEPIAPEILSEAVAEAGYTVVG
ncbi:MULTISPECIES: heavy-metal-associated domain-containing protein [Arthrobacter]|uniref:Heavy-metal-associated domain-containing protein n=1 Tax=Arthrobacter caoxuetaonis TaxID=2886935 RepID=A0A9X1MFF4_9MICC|nr:MULTISPECIES: heavy-metal-associated domain-containing protein [Arthrobacter]MCC3283764.1 heavy-metal-associated domain-containing protein [Arthrobacter caoxuetaonis]MCC3299094.1 heavy-metal-associated domain-containing protein [Arthrobacter caoxuetaonis]MCC9193201.1 heavy-metal-associated domain-containing protein [Arthrobacter sp. zg-Y916]USQ58572.1 heavy-metal-associated domain-containing protein [Arthrobacter caoxuetaonis]